MRGERVRDAIGADLGGVVHAEPHPRLHTRADDERGLVQIALGEPRERHRERRDDGAEHERVDVLEREILASEERVDRDGELVLRLVRLGRGTPGREEARALVRAEDDVRVARVDGQERHLSRSLRWPRCAWPACPYAP